MMQYSIYIRNCINPEYADTYSKRIASIIPSTGNVHILKITGKQYENIVSFFGEDSKHKEIKKNQQIELL